MLHLLLLLLCLLHISNLQITLVLIDPLYSPTPVCTWYSLPWTSILHPWLLTICSYTSSIVKMPLFPDPDSFIDAGACEEATAGTEADTGHIVRVRLHRVLLTTLQVVHSAVVGVGANHYTWGHGLRTIHWPGGVVRVTSGNIAELYWILIYQLREEEHAPMARVVNCH